MKPAVVKDLLKFNWQAILDYGNSLDDVNGRQWLFIKGLSIELAVEKYSEDTFRYVGLDHQDFQWDKHKLSVELKSQFSNTMYTSKGKLRRTYKIRLNNSYGGNKNEPINPAHVTDALVLLLNDGALAIDRSVILKYSKFATDGWIVKVPSTEIVELSGCLGQKNIFKSQLKDDIVEVIKNSLPNV